MGDRSIEKKLEMIKVVMDAANTIKTPIEAFRIIIRAIYKWHFAVGREVKALPTQNE